MREKIGQEYKTDEEVVEEGKKKRKTRKVKAEKRRK